MGDSVSQTVGPACFPLVVRIPTDKAREWAMARKMRISFYRQWAETSDAKTSFFKTSA